MDSIFIGDSLQTIKVCFVNGVRAAHLVGAAFAISHDYVADTA